MSSVDNFEILSVWELSYSKFDFLFETDGLSSISSCVVLPSVLPKL